MALLRWLLWLILNQCNIYGSPFIHCDWKARRLKFAGSGKKGKGTRWVQPCLNTTYHNFHPSGSATCWSRELCKKHISKRGEVRHKPFSSFISLNQSGDFYHPFLIDFFRGGGREAVEGRKKPENKIPLWLQTFLSFPPTLTQLNSLRPYFFFMWLENAPIITVFNLWFR